ncbi:MAG: VWA domain-containing protein [Halothiobacillaceae bacterium]|nr:VWA domain-containing protein [Halothiobacillaceae bacterium]
MTALHWHWPWAFLLMLIPLAFILLSLRQRSRLLDYAEPALRPWALFERPQAGLGRMLLHSVAWLCFAMALAGPRLPVESPNTPSASRQDVRIMALLDVSDSMHAADIAPSRLERARLKLHDLPDVLAGESLGLAVFAGTAGVVMPPSSDPAVFRYALQQSEHLLDDAPGSELASALDAAARGLPKASEDVKHSARAILLISDGESDMLHGNAVLLAVEKLREAGIPLFILGMATEQGAPIPDGAGGYRQLDDQPFQSRMDAAALQEMAQRTGGGFVPVSDGDTDLRTLAEAMHALPSHPSPGVSRAWNELFYWPLLTGLMLLLLAYSAPYRRSELAREKNLAPNPSQAGPSQASSQIHKQHGNAHLALLSFLLPLAALSILASHAAHAAQPPASPASAYAAWQRGDFVQAQLLYASLAGVEARMGEGAAAYRRGDFNHAAQAFTSAWLLATTNPARADALYNLGNAELQAGRSERAVAAYEQVLRLRPKDENAASNLWLAQQRSEEKRMKKSRPEDPPGRKPTDFARYNDDITPDFPTDEAQSGGDLSAGGAGTGQKRKAGDAVALNLSEADRLAAEKKMELLEDQPNPVWRAMLRRDTPERKNEGLPW